MNENYSPIPDNSQNKLIIKDNNITHNIPELDELNQISEGLTNNMICRYNLRVYVIYVFQILSIISFIIFVSTSGVAFYLFLMFFFCFEAWIITMNFIGVDEYLFLRKDCIPLNKILEEYFYNNNISIEFYVVDWCTKIKRVGTTLPLPCQSCLDISGLFTLNPVNNGDSSYFILYIKKQVTFIGDPNLISSLFKSINEGFKKHNNNACMELKKDIHFGESIEQCCVRIAVNDPPYKFYVKTGASNPPSKLHLIGIVANLIGLGGVYLFYLRNIIFRKDFMVKKVMSTEDLETIKQRYPNSNPGILINNNKYMFDAQKIGNNIPQNVPENFDIKVY